MEDLTTAVSEFTVSIDTMWILIAAVLVMFMQPGFALVEAGFTRSKNTINILMKNQQQNTHIYILYMYLYEDGLTYAR